MIRYTKLLQSQSRAIELVFVLVALAGFLAFQFLPSNVYPELSFPRIAVIAEVGDISPERVIVSVTRLLEEAVGQVYKVRWVRSKTIRGSTEISVDFQPSTDMQFALQQLQAKIAEIRATLPPSTNLTIERVTPAIFPIIGYNISSDTLTLADLYTIARYQIQPRLTRVPGVARVQLQGGDIQQISVQVDPTKLKGEGLSLADVATALQRTNQMQVVGKLDQNYEQNLVVATGESVKPSDLGGIVVVTSKAGTPVFLRDLGTISWGWADRTKLISVDGKPGLTLNVFRQPNSNVVDVSNEVRKELVQVEKSLPPGIKVRAAYDESGLVVDAIKNVKEAIGIGILLIIIVLFVSLRDWRSTLIAALSIPLSALAAFGVLYLTGQSLNLMSLGGVAVAIGLVIDDAVVVIENIDHQLSKGLDPQAAVTTALEELLAPVVSSSITTVVVFLPLGLLSGVAGQFFTSFTLTLSAAVLFSLVLSLTLTPTLAARWLKPKKNVIDKPVVPQGGFYAGLIRRLFKQPIWLCLFTLTLIIAGAAMFKQVGSDFLPSMDEGSYIIDYFAPPGTSLIETDALAQRLEQVLAKTPEVKAWTRRTGAENGLFATQINSGDILVVLKPVSQRQRKVWQIFDDQRKQFAEKLPQLDVDFHQILQDELNDLSGVSSPVDLRIYGQEPDNLRTQANIVKDKIKDVRGLVDVVTTGRVGAPQIDARVDPIQAGRLGLTTNDIITQVQDAMLGGIATQVRQTDRLVDVRIRLQDAVRNDPAQLAEIPITGPTGKMLPLSAVAKISHVAGEGEIRRENQQRYISIQAGVEQRDLGSVIADIKKQLTRFKLPVGYSMNIGGLYSTQQESFTQLLEILALGIVLVYLILVIQFRSWTQPFAIFIAVPLAMFGVVAGLLLTNTSLNVSSFMGIILLVGLVVKNGIILLDYTNHLRKDGLSLDDALIAAGTVRIRPILITTLCTILGLLPLGLGFGAGAELQKPLAIAVIGGLSLSTIFTLVFMPVIFRILEGIGKKPIEVFKETELPVVNAETHP